VKLTSIKWRRSFAQIVNDEFGRYPGILGFTKYFGKSDKFMVIYAS